MGRLLPSIGNLSCENSLVMDNPQRLLTDQVLYRK